MTIKSKNFKIKKFVLVLVSLVFICYGAGALIILSSGGTIYDIFNRGNFNGFLRNNFRGYGNELNLERSESISLKDISKINVSTTFSDVKVIYNDGEELRADLKGSVRGTLSSSDIELILTSSNGEVNVKQTSPSGMNINFSDAGLTLYIPKSYSKAMDISTISGDVDLSQVNLDTTGMKIKTISGDIRCNNIKTKDMEINSTSGSVSINKLISSTLKSSQISGDININDFEGAIELKTTSGEIRLKMNKINDSAKISSISGDVDLYINPSINIEFDINSVSGDVSLDNSLNTSGIIKKSKGSIKVNSGGISSSISTTSGDIRIKSN
ncbi:DUF4097 family beta strand repeat-containing protein [Clostridium hydrogeniformans]|uniref:DUF4097 family beta strand repeat-containing protein n=1 Tax=Clostridium hydrogeniformans TaxID=349933 RepID=UPI00048A4154|nr:DUF4097 family beta strand repeat-containing protein [Clostridium hydrogeniformans]